jgi:hypothetical protein
MPYRAISIRSHAQAQSVGIWLAKKMATCTGTLYSTAPLTGSLGIVIVWSLLNNTLPFFAGSCTSTGQSFLRRRLFDAENGRKATGTHHRSRVHWFGTQKTHSILCQSQKTRSQYRGSSTYFYRHGTVRVPQNVNFIEWRRRQRNLRLPFPSNRRSSRIPRFGVV